MEFERHKDLYLCLSLHCDIVYYAKLKNNSVFYYLVC